MRLFLCEKPSQGKDIAMAIGARQRRDGFYEGAGNVVTWCVGHLVETAPPDAYDPELKKWSLDSLPIVPRDWRVVVKPKTAKQFKVIKSLLGKASELVIATDADREGEMIARELLELCGYRGKVSRLWLSALNEPSIRKAMADIRPGNSTERMYFSALGRSRADWLIGMNLTRLFTLLGQRAGYEGVLSVGRVQTPTLKLVADREREVNNFVPVPFWVVLVQLSTQTGSFTATWVCPEDLGDERGRCTNQQVAHQAAAAIQAAGMAQVTAVTVKRVRENPPLPYELGELQKVCSARFGMGAQKTLDTVQALYETHKIVTYPRVDTGYLPENMHSEASAILAAIACADPAMGQLISQANTQLRSPAWNDEKVTAHHGIIPTTEVVQLGNLSKDELGVYNLIKLRYLQQFFPAHEYDKTDVVLDAAGHMLKASGKVVAVQGWRVTLGGNQQEDDTEADKAAADNGDSGSSNQALPELTQGMGCHVGQISLQDRLTKPPSLFTEGTLIVAMKNVSRLVTDPRLKAKLKETTGIGTNATRAGIIKNLLDRGLIVTKKKHLIASSEAHDFLQALPPAISDPGTTAIWEQALDMIEGGQMDLDSFVAKQSTWIGNIVEKYRNQSIQIKVTVPAGPACPLCSSPMKKRKGKTSDFWGCSKYPECKGIVNIETKKKTARKSTSRK